MIRERTANPVNNQPVPMALMSGSATIVAMQANVFRRRLLTATPWDGFFGMYSVNMVVTMEKISILPIPNNTFAIDCRKYMLTVNS